MDIGARYLGDATCEFIVWAPFSKHVSVRTVSPEERLIPMERDGRGYFRTTVTDISPETLYFYRLEGKVDRPDPASNFQPEGVHGPSSIVDHSLFQWEGSAWTGIPLKEMLVYELHAGTFTPEGTFEAIIPRLEALKDLGVNALELMPVAQFAGGRNWGYDGVFPFSVQDSYGGPEGLRRLVNACHQKGFSVILDVVYNHLGPEGNYLGDFGPYFTERYKTPWGRAINFDGACSDEVRSFFIQNALYWFQNYHIDALRLDAVHAIYDFSPRPFLLELSEKVEEFSCKNGRRFYLIAESDLNDTRLIQSAESGGLGMDAQWCDDFHHSIHALLTGERTGYYMDFGSVGDLVKSLKEGFVYSWSYSRYRKRHHGSSSSDIPPGKFLVFSQNHDQVGNRMLGERLSVLTNFEALKLTAGIVILSPYIPLLFMGEEYAEESPFLYFIDHIDNDLVEAVRKGRKEEFNKFKWEREPPDPKSPETFFKSKLDWNKREEGRHRVLLDFYRQLIKLRKENPALLVPDEKRLEVSGMEEERVVFLQRWRGENTIFCIFNFNEKDIPIKIDIPQGVWKKVIDSSDTKWNGPGSIMPGKIVPGERAFAKALSFVLYKQQLPSLYTKNEGDL